ncbi:MAG: helix-turn-helix domain-containing protein [Alphaproteobacteria bacterium]
MAGLSGYQLDKRIRALFGLSGGQYITRARVEHTCNLLKQSVAPISTIALDCGYSDQAAFSRQSRRSVRLSPAAYRKTSNAPKKTAAED